MCAKQQTHGPLLKYIAVVFMLVAVCAKLTACSQAPVASFQAAPVAGAEPAVQWVQINATTWRMIDPQTGTVCFKSNDTGRHDGWMFGCAPLQYRQ